MGLTTTFTRSVWIVAAGQGNLLTTSRSAAAGAAAPVAAAVRRCSRALATELGATAPCMPHPPAGRNPTFSPNCDLRIRAIFGASTSYSSNAATPSAAAAIHSRRDRSRSNFTSSIMKSGCSSDFRSISTTSAVGSEPSPPRGAPPTPRELGFRMPGEIERHAGTWMAFPYDPYLWRDAARPAQEQQADIAKAISQFEQVWMLADPQVYDIACGYFRGGSGVEVIRMPTNDVWARDWGPTCVVRDDPSTGEREVAAVHFDYNCYGSPTKMEHGLPPLMPDWSKDRAAVRSLPRLAGIRAFECPMRLEGGAVQSDGQGTMLVTEECLLHFSRNPQLGREGNEALLREYFGAERVLWLPKGMVGDDLGTNGHVDNVAAFAEPGTVLLAWSDDPSDPVLRDACAANLTALEGQKDARGRPLRIIKVPCPSPPLTVSPVEVNSVAVAAVATGYGTALSASVRMPASYINHYVVNGGVVVPQFGGEQGRSDAEALSVLASAYPGRRVVGVYSRELLLGGGNIHCLTQNLPEAARSCQKLPEAAKTARH